MVRQRIVRSVDEGRGTFVGSIEIRGVTILVYGWLRRSREVSHGIWGEWGSKRLGWLKEQMNLEIFWYKGINLRGEEENETGTQLLGKIERNNHHDLYEWKIFVESTSKEKRLLNDEGKGRVWKKEYSNSLPRTSVLKDVRERTSHAGENC